MKLASLLATAALMSVVKLRRPAAVGLLDDFGQARFVYRDAPGVEHINLGRIIVDADDGVTYLREAGAGGQADVARADHSDFHTGNYIDSLS